MGTAFTLRSFVTNGGVPSDLVSRKPGREFQLFEVTVTRIEILLSVLCNAANVEAEHVAVFIL